MKNLIARFVREDEGQDLVEYTLLIAFIALACIVGMQSSERDQLEYGSIASSLTKAPVDPYGRAAECRPARRPAGRRHQDVPPLHLRGRCARIDGVFTPLRIRRIIGVLVWNNT